LSDDRVRYGDVGYVAVDRKGSHDTETSSNIMFAPLAIVIASFPASPCCTHPIANVAHDGIVGARVRHTIPVDSDTLPRRCLTSNGDTATDDDPVCNGDEAAHGKHDDLSSSTRNLRLGVPEASSTRVIKISDNVNTTTPAACRLSAETLGTRKSQQGEQEETVAARMVASKEGFIFDDACTMAEPVLK